jgi:bifunctional enzyme CysN/CysC
MKINYAVDVNTGTHYHTDKLLKNELASCEISLCEKVVFDLFEKQKALGSFILIDRVSNATSACGVIVEPARRLENTIWQDTDITRELRSAQKAQKPYTIWFTGLSGSGKSTLANELEKRLFAMGKHTMLLDGDNIRHGLNKNLGFLEVDRVENIRRIAEVSKLMNDAGLITLTAFISPYERDRETAREIIGDRFIEIYVSTPMEECMRRDVKGLYRKASNNEIPNFTGISSPYEPPLTPDITIDTRSNTVQESVDILMRQLTGLIDLI